MRSKPWFGLPIAILVIVIPFGIVLGFACRLFRGRLRLGLDGGQILGDGAALLLRIGPFKLVWRLAMVATGIGLDHARIDREALRLSEKVEWCGMRSSRSSRQNHR